MNFYKFKISTYFQVFLSGLEAIDSFMKSHFSTSALRLLATSALSATLTCGLLAAPSQAAPSLSPHVAGQILLHFTPSTSAAAKTSVLAKIGGSIKHTYSTGWVLANVPSTETAFSALKNRSEVAAVEPNYLFQSINPIKDDTAADLNANKSVRASTTPNDPYYPQMWGLKQIGAAEAWKTTTGSNDVVVAVMDTGVRITHNDLKANIYTNQIELHGKPGVDDDHNGFVDDVHGWNSVESNGDVNDIGSVAHGTIIAGVIGAVGNNGRGIVGVNWRVKILPIRMQKEQGTVDNHVSAVMEGIDYLLALRKQGVNVRGVNCSFDLLGDQARSLYDSFKALSQAGVLISCAAGNANHNSDLIPTYPEDYVLPNIITAGATTITDERADFSDFGFKTVHIFAPGRSIISTNNTSDDGITVGSGTSYSAPYVLGAAALLWSSQPNLTAQQVKTRLLASATHVKALRPFVTDGRRLNVGGLLNNAVHTISGSTLTTEGTTSKPVAGVGIFLDNNNGTPDAITNGAGRYTLANVMGGNHRVRAQRTGMTFSAPVTVYLPVSKAADPTTVTANFIAQTPITRLYSIIGTVEQIIPGQENRPKAGVDVYLNDSPSPLARSNAQGKWIIKNLLPNAYAVRLIDSQTGQVAPDVKVVYLPVTTPRSEGFPYAPNGNVETAFPFFDDRAPSVYNLNINDGNTFPLTAAPTHFIGSVKDETGIASFEVRFFRALPDYSVIEVYDGTGPNPGWKPYEQLPLAIIPGSGRAQFDFDLALPNYFVSGYIYDLYYVATDTTGNSTASNNFFYLKESATPSAAPSPSTPSSPSS
ncbi:thermophilic serine proteinase [Abditibacteriota bacterium]|nr:thermophilic serine proteinase [Abditibacteriota bacterium]